MHVLHTRALKGNILKVYRHYAPSQKLLFNFFFSETITLERASIYITNLKQAVGEAQS